jgi:hypothetical protein
MTVGSVELHWRCAYSQPISERLPASAWFSEACLWHLGNTACDTVILTATCLQSTEFLQYPREFGPRAIATLQRLPSGVFISLTVGEVAFLIEVVVKRGMDGSELLRGLHFPKSLYRSLPSSEGQRAVFRPIVHPVAYFTTIDIAEFTHGSVVASHSFGKYLHG